MDNKYISLFSELTKANIMFAEQVEKYDRQLNDEKGANNAQLMREDFMLLDNRITDGSILQKNDYVKLLVCALTVSNSLLEKIKTYQTALQGYKTDLIPKLQRIVEEASTDEEAQNLANELFETLEKI